MSRSITISYNLHPPTSTSTSKPTPTASPPPSTPKLTPTKSQQIPLKGTYYYGEGQEDPTTFQSYYESLRRAISEAKSVLGEDLTAWRDAVGSGEKFKEGKRAMDGEDEEDVEQEEDG